MTPEEASEVMYLIDKLRNDIEVSDATSWDVRRLLDLLAGFTEREWRDLGEAGA